MRTRAESGRPGGGPVSHRRMHQFRGSHATGPRPGSWHLPKSWLQWHRARRGRPLSARPWPDFVAGCLPAIHRRVATLRQYFQADFFSEHL
jgi:hypothetical protein